MSSDYALTPEDAYQLDFPNSGGDYNPYGEEPQYGYTAPTAQAQAAEDARMAAARSVPNSPSTIYTMDAASLANMGAERQTDPVWASPASPYFTPGSNNTTTDSATSKGLFSWLGAPTQATSNGQPLFSLFGSGTPLMQSQQQLGQAPAFMGPATGTTGMQSNIPGGLARMSNLTSSQPVVASSDAGMSQSTILILAAIAIAVVVLAKRK